MTEEAHVRSTAQRRNLRPIFNKEKLAMWFFLGGEVILFATLILTFGTFRINFSQEYAAFRANLSIPLIAINTLVLIVSSYFVVRGLTAIRANRLNATFINLTIVFILGALFIGGQAYEWSQLFGKGIRVDNVFGSAFFVLTGIHGMHVLVGLAWDSIVLLFGINGSYDKVRFRAVEFFGLYWHFVDIVWIVLFSLIYLL
jgi:heme/copper-type cytochrome/quinol oxidase subunit 3